MPPPCPASSAPCTWGLRGFVASVAIGSTAFGPVLFAVSQEAAGTYRGVLLASALAPLAVMVPAVLTRPPAPPPLGASAQE